MKLRSDNTFTRSLTEDLLGLNLKSKKAKSLKSFSKTARDSSNDLNKPNRIKVASTQGQQIIKQASSLARGYKASPDGSIWSIETDGSGDQWLVRNTAETEAAQIIQSLV